MSYAQGTEVPVERSEAELKRLLVKHGASHIGYLSGPDETVLVFVMRERRIRQTVKHPDPADYQTTPTGRTRSTSDVISAVDRELRRRWRALVLIVKAKLELVAEDPDRFEAEFLADTVLPDGHTVGELLLQRIAQTSQRGEKQPLLLSAGPRPEYPKRTRKP